MKTALQHFNELPEPYGQMAIEETISFCSDGLEDKHKLASSAIMHSFSLGLSKMGGSFWHGIIDNLLHLESQSK